MGDFALKCSLPGVGGSVGAKIWEVDEHRKSQFSESGGSLNGLTSSLNCLSCRIPYQSLHSLNALPSFGEKALLFTDSCFAASPSPKTAPIRTSWLSHKSSFPSSLHFMGREADLRERVHLGGVGVPVGCEWV